MNGLVIDLFAGGGGTSTGIARAIGRDPDVAVNHDAAAIACHRANHPPTRHYCASVYDVRPRDVCGGRSVELLWASPDCTHHSRAKGGKPLKKKIRGLAWVVVKWASAVRPRVIALENVEEFADWGPLGPDNRPIKSLAGRFFDAWVGKLRKLGYVVEWRSLVAADYGAPTTRRRLFLVARCDGEPIRWPEPTHGKGRARPWRTAAEIIDWSVPTRSIFGRQRPLAEATLRRIALGIERYVLREPSPFVVKYHGGSAWRGQTLDEPLRTVDTSNRFALVEPFVVRHGHYSTITGAGLREGCGAGTFRGQSLHRPLATVCATNDKHLVVPLVTKHFGGVVGHDVCRPLGTVTAKDHHALTTATLGDLAERRAEVEEFLESHGIGASRQGSLFGGPKLAIIDIGTRMLIPRELFRAQGFPDDYEIAPELDGRPLTKTAQTRLVGNSVPPCLAEHVVRANLPVAESDVA